MPENVIIGVNTLETLTTGMYKDSRVILREYIQNSCDQIDAAVRSGLLAEDEAVSPAVSSSCSGWNERRRASEEMLKDRM